MYHILLRLFRNKEETDTGAGTSRFSSYTTQLRGARLDPISLLTRSVLRSQMNCQKDLNRHLHTAFTEKAFSGNSNVLARKRLKIYHEEKAVSAPVAES